MDDGGIDDGGIAPVASHEFWRVLYTCTDCNVDVVRLVRGNPDEVVRCFGCEWTHVRSVSDRLLRSALLDANA